MRKDGYDARVTKLLRREGFFLDARSYLGHTVDDMQPHLHREGADRSRLRDWLFKDSCTCQLKLRGCTGVATQMDHKGEAVDGARFDERKHVRRACDSCHKLRHNRELQSAKITKADSDGL